MEKTLCIYTSTYNQLLTIIEFYYRSNENYVGELYNLRSNRATPAPAGVARLSLFVLFLSEPTGSVAGKWHDRVKILPKPRTLQERISN